MTPTVEPIVINTGDEPLIVVAEIISDILNDLMIHFNTLYHGTHYEDLSETGKQEVITSFIEILIKKYKFSYDEAQFLMIELSPHIPTSTKPPEEAKPSHELQTVTYPWTNNDAFVTNFTSVYLIIFRVFLPNDSSSSLLKLSTREIYEKLSKEQKDYFKTLHGFIQKRDEKGASDFIAKNHTVIPPYLLTNISPVLKNVILNPHFVARFDQFMEIWSQAWSSALTPVNGQTADIESPLLAKKIAIVARLTEEEQSKVLDDLEVLFLCYAKTGFFYEELPEKRQQKLLKRTISEIARLNQLKPEDVDTFLTMNPGKIPSNTKQTALLDTVESDPRLIISECLNIFFVLLQALLPNEFFINEKVFSKIEDIVRALPHEKSKVLQTLLNLIKQYDEKSIQDFKDFSEKNKSIVDDNLCKKICSFMKKLQDNDYYVEVFDEQVKHFSLLFQVTQETSPSKTQMEDMTTLAAQATQELATIRSTSTTPKDSVKDNYRYEEVDSASNFQHFVTARMDETVEDSPLLREATPPPLQTRFTKQQTNAYSPTVLGISHQVDKIWDDKRLESQNSKLVYNIFSNADNSHIEKFSIYVANVFKKILGAFAANKATDSSQQLVIIKEFAIKKLDSFLLAELFKLIRNRDEEGINNFAVQNKKIISDDLLDDILFLIENTIDNTKCYEKFLSLLSLFQQDLLNTLSREKYQILYSDPINPDKEAIEKALASLKP